MTDLPTILFTDSLSDMDFIIMSSKEFVRMITELKIKVIFSSYNRMVMNDDFLYLIYDGIIFVPHSGNVEEIEKFFNIEEDGGFPDFFTYLAAKRIEVEDYSDYSEFKKSPFFGYDRSNYCEYLDAKKTGEI